MYEQIVAAIKTALTWYHKHRRHAILHIAKWLFGLGLPLLSIWFIAQKMSSGYESIGAVITEFHIPTLLWATLCITTATALGALEWVWLVNALGARLDIIKGVRIHLLSNLTKYIPGFVWPYMGKAYLSTQTGVASSVAGASLIIDFAAVIVGGAALALICLPLSDLISWTPWARAGAELAILIGVGMSFVTANRWGVALTRQKALSGKINFNLEHVNWQHVFLACFAILLTWCILGMGFVLLHVALPSVQVDEARLIIALAAAMLIGQLIIFVPLGLGVREAIFVAILSPQISATTITIVAVFFRMLMMAGEIAWALGSMGLAAIYHRHTANTPKG